MALVPVVFVLLGDWLPVYVLGVVVPLVEVRVTPLLFVGAEVADLLVVVVVDLPVVVAFEVLLRFSVKTLF